MNFVWDTSPLLFSLGPLSVHWYGLCFALALWLGLLFMQRVFVAENQSQNTLDRLFLYVVIGIIIGARLAHCLFYEPTYYLAHPLEILFFWKGGLASHGGGLGAAIGAYLVTRKASFSFIWLLDRLAIPTAIFGVFVRTGNFFNSEILGQATGRDWGVVFARIDQVARHPAQLYEAIGYLISLILLSLLYRPLKNHAGALFGTFLVLIFSVRIAVETVKQGQAVHMQDSLLSMGQWLSLPFITLGIALLVRAAYQAKRLA